jgi:hypothetical protein
LGPDSLPLSEPLKVRLRAWTEGDHHLWNEEVLGYEFDDPAYDQVWHDEGLALLAELRAELGPRFDIVFERDLDA